MALHVCPKELELPEANQFQMLGASTAAAAAARVSIDTSATAAL